METQQEEGRGSAEQKTKKQKNPIALRLRPCALRPAPPAAPLRPCPTPSCAPAYCACTFPFAPLRPCYTEPAPRSHLDSLALRPLPCAPYCVDPAAAPLSL
ncbi:hypothetical protein SLEP1_g53145 [Rubroshorea leprosula]|uniref:Uncharacterized protein n=1 Tax=Rubroshorea leprosula TaxID=152421 RepID=A0AAV5M9H0_9ROSI|nr:hypothetical protein SLEP1_g53145 [Rubroshorea leprosula]